MATATHEEIQQLVEALDCGRQAWISGQLETTANEHMAQAEGHIASQQVRYFMSHEEQCHQNRDDKDHITEPDG